MLLAQKDMNCLIKWYLMSIVENMLGDRYYEPKRSPPSKRAGSKGQEEREGEEKEMNLFLIIAYLIIVYL